MPLFQHSVLKKFLSNIDEAKMKNAWQLFQSHFFNSVIQQNIRNSKEEEYQEGFVRDLFVNVLGYTLNPQPDYNFVLEKKTVTDATKSDGAILLNGDVIGVVELKDTGTPDLDKVSTQAFGYKHKHKNCTYVVTSNFEKLRFYINDATDFEEFELFTLSQERFALLFLCLHYKNIQANIPLQIKQQSLVQEKNVTEKLYQDYSLFKRKLFQNIAEQNRQHDKLLLFKKTQKLLDRFLFIFFAEDKSLLPPNSVREILKQWEQLKELDNYVPLYDRFKKYFGYLNVGHVGKQHEIFAYNGGLFLPDEILDNIIIDDTILYNGTKTLSGYDFETDVDVNILGHIFEHSLTEIEELQMELEGKAIEKNKTKRKKEGVFYTPRYITKYIVENTVGALCTQKKEELEITEETFAPQKRKALKKILLEKIVAYRKWLLQLTICDPACGSGAFLNAALEYLKTEHRTADELTARIFGDTIVYTDLDNSILEHNLFGVDINEDAIEIAKLSLWLHTAKKGRKLSNLSNNIKCGNSLIDDATVAGDKAFNWHEEFKNVFSPSLRGGTTKQSPDGTTGFDVVIGNPPYVRAELLIDIREYLENTYKVFHNASDLFSYFYEKSFQLLKYNGRFAFISNAFDKTTAAVGLRNWLQEKVTINNYVDFTEVQVFDGATTYPVIITAINNSPLNNYFNYVKVVKANLKSFNSNVPSSVEQSLLKKENWTFHNLESSTLIQKIKNHQVVKKIYGKCYYGVKTALNEAFLIPKNLFNNSQFIKPIWEGKDLQKWISTEPEQDLILFKSRWTESVFGKMEEETAFKKLQETFPEIALHLLPFKDKAKARYDQGDYWWELRNCAYYELFEKPKIVFPNLQNSNKFSIDEKGIFINAPAVMVSLTHLHNPINQSKFLLSLLNSKVVWYFLKSICVIRNGGYIEVKPQYFEQIPIPEIANTQQQPFIDKADIMLEKNKELHQLSEQFIKLLQTKYPTISINNKLQSWYSLTATDFFKELAKQKIKLPLTEQQEWLQYFEQQKTNANNIQQTIQQTDAAIDAMVYQLYGLTEDEIKIVEGKDVVQVNGEKVSEYEQFVEDLKPLLANLPLIELENDSLDFLVNNTSFGKINKHVLASFVGAIKTLIKDDNKFKDELKSLQRIVDISPVPEVIPVLMQSDVTSALNISEESETEFIQHYKQKTSIVLYLFKALESWLKWQRVKIISEKN